MRNLIRKDLILNRTVLIVNAALMGGWLIFLALYDTEMPPKLYAGFASLMLSFLPVSLVAREDKFDAMTLGCSLPVTRRTIVQARFLLGLASAVVGVTAVFALVGLLPYGSFGLVDLFAVGPLLVALTMSVLVLSLILPFTLRFGMKGLMVLLVGFQVLGVLLLTLVQLTGSSADRQVVDTIIRFFERAGEILGLWGFRGALLAVLALMLGLAYRTAVWTFERRDI